ncbi:hypothetical protein FHX69_3054 [Prauserella muralis]|nr:hypothetical protein FHX69_3054 [Prauserella muralis]
MPTNDPCSSPAGSTVAPVVFSHPVTQSPASEPTAASDRARQVRFSAAPSGLSTGPRR